MITKWLHINTSYDDFWILPIWKSVNDAVTSGKIKPIPNYIKELGLHISTRLEFFPFIIQRINSGIDQIYEVAGNHNKENIYTELIEGYALQMDRDLVYSLLIYIDSILFELNSVCELMTKLFEKLYAHVGKPINKECAGLKIKSVIEKNGKNSNWFQELDKHRNFFMHNGAPYLAIDISIVHKNYDLLIMKENINSFKDKSKFLKLSDINKIVHGFASAKPIIQQHLINLFSQ